MDATKIEKQIKLIPLFCCVGVLALRGLVGDKSSGSMTIWVLVLASIAVLSFMFRIYLEKKNGTLVLKRYYLLFVVLILTTAMFIYNLLTIPS